MCVQKLLAKTVFTFTTQRGYGLTSSFLPRLPPLALTTQVKELWVPTVLYTSKLLLFSRRLTLAESILHLTDPINSFRFD